MAIPQTRYARSGDLNIAYQTVGDGPFHLLWIPGFVSNVELAWEEPSLAHFFRRLGSFSTLILFDKRGTGLSDRVPRDQLPTLEERVDDVRAVLDAVGVDRAALVGHSEGGNLAMLFAATHPERTIALVTLGVFAKRLWSQDYPWAPTPEQRAIDIAEVELHWGETADVDHYAPSAAGDDAFRRRLATYFRLSASPGDAAALLRMNSQVDIRDVLPSIRVPTLVIHHTGDRDANIEEGRWIASRIPGARFVELPGDDHFPWVGDGDRVLDEIEEFLTGERGETETDTILATVLFTDIVGSTQRAASMGDSKWSELLQAHHDVVRRELDRYRGREVDTAGDGFLAVFDGPARAVRAACAIRDALHRLGIEIRAGVHTGECRADGKSLRGLAVHAGARIAALAGPGEVLVSGTVRDLTPGSRLVFESRGEVELRGVPGRWEVLAVVGDDAGHTRTSDPSTAAYALLAGLDSVTLSSFAVVGHYMRFDETVRNQLKDLRDRIDGSLIDPGSRRNVFLLHAAPGAGKTYLVREIAASLEGVDLQEVNLASVDEAAFNRALSDATSARVRRICFIDECDAKPAASWPYELLLPALDGTLSRGQPIVFALAGSSGVNVEEFKQLVASRPKGADLLSRVPNENVYSLGAMSLGDRLLVALSNLLGASRSLGRAVNEVEKLALLYLLVDRDLGSARQLHEFVLRAAERLHPGETRLKYDHLFNAGDPKNKAFWNQWQAHSALAGRYLSIAI
jgi:pimeloyl-ACP methyl ester carboxylesterase